MDRGCSRRRVSLRARPVVIWGGCLVGKEEAGRARAEGKVVMQLEDGLYSVEERGEDATYFMNHSCDPNVWMAGVVTLVARRDIEPGEELTVDYALFEAYEGFVGTWECVCGSTPVADVSPGGTGRCRSSGGVTPATSCLSLPGVLRHCMSALQGRSLDATPRVTPRWCRPLR